MSLYTDHPEQTDTRPTDDVDVLVEIATYTAYTKLQTKLAGLGFAIDVEAKITCRYKYQGLTVDIMPIEGDVLGFKNQWYKEGFENLQTYAADPATEIRIFPVAFFIASKLDAFNDRGNSDGRTSKDFEDIIFVLDNRSSIWEDLVLYGRAKEYIKHEFAKLLSFPYIDEWISAHLDTATSGARTVQIMEEMEKMTI